MNLQHQKIIAEELRIRISQVASAANLLADGATIPFISRYRKEATGSLDEVQIAAIRDHSAVVSTTVFNMIYNGTLTYWFFKGFLKHTVFSDNCSSRITAVTIKRQVTHFHRNPSFATPRSKCWQKRKIENLRRSSKNEFLQEKKDIFENILT